MANHQLSRITAAFAACVLISSGAHAVMLPGPSGFNAPAKETSNILASMAVAATTLVDRIETDYFARHEPVNYLTSDDHFAGPYTLFVTTRENSQNRQGMILASLALMGLIAHRRRMME